MIVPRNIIFWSAMMLPFSAAAPHGGAFMALFALLGGALFLVAAWDAAAVALTAGKISITAPPVSRMQQGDSGKIPFTITKPEFVCGELVFAPSLPPEAEALEDEVTLFLPYGKNSRFECGFKPVQRGAFRIGTAFFELKSPWGMWSFRKRNPFDGEIRVYPDTNLKRSGLAALLLRNSFSGSRLNKMLGAGREFEKMRDYLPSDSYDIISWKATAKRGKPICREFQVERSQEVYAVIDASRFSGKKKGDTFSLDYYFTAALALGRAAEKQGDLFGIIVFDDQPRTFIKAGSGTAHHKACREIIYALKPATKSPDFENLFSFIKMNIRKRAFLVFLTDLDERSLAENFTRNISLASRRHLCAVNMLKDSAVSPLFEVPVSDDSEICERLAGHVKWAWLMEVQKVLSKYGAGFSMAEREKFSLHLIDRYMDMKRRQKI